MEHFFPSGNGQRIWGLGVHSSWSTWALVLLSNRRLVPRIPYVWLWTVMNVGDISWQEESIHTLEKNRLSHVLQMGAHQRWAEPETLCHIRGSLFASRTAKVMSENITQDVFSFAAKCISTRVKDKHRDPEFKEKGFINHFRSTSLLTRPNHNMFASLACVFLAFLHLNCSALQDTWLWSIIPYGCC